MTACEECESSAGPRALLFRHDQEETQLKQNTVAAGGVDLFAADCSCCCSLPTAYCMPFLAALLLVASTFFPRARFQLGLSPHVPKLSHRVRPPVRFRVSMTSGRCHHRLAILFCPTVSTYQENQVPRPWLSELEFVFPLASALCVQALPFVGSRLGQRLVEQEPGSGRQQQTCAILLGHRRLECSVCAFPKHSTRH